MANVANVLSIPRALRLFQRKRWWEVQCAVTDVLGRCVYIHDDEVAGRYQVRTCDPSDLSKMPAVGIIISKESDTECTIQTFGEVKGIHGGLVPNAPLYVASNGELDHDAPIPNGGEVYIQNVGEAISSTTPWFWPFSKMVRRFDTNPDNKAVKFDDVDDVFEEVTFGGVVPSTAALFYRPLLGIQDGANRTYTTVEKFQPDTMQVYHNSRELVRAMSPSPRYGDFYVSESSGPGTGYDTVTILSFSPVEFSRMWAHYHAVL